MGADLPVEVKSNTAIGEDKDEEDDAWTKRGYQAITSFLPGAAPKPPHRVLLEARARCPTGTCLGTACPYRPIPYIPCSHERGAVCIAPHSANPKSMEGSGPLPLETPSDMWRASASFHPRQCGRRWLRSNVRNATEMVGMGLRRLVQSHASTGAKDYVVFQVDVHNAFNFVSREADLSRDGTIRDTYRYVSLIRIVYIRDTSGLMRG